MNDPYSDEPAAADDESGGGAGGDSAEAQIQAVAEAAARIATARQTAATGLSLANLGLRDVPPSLAELTHLEALSLRGNRLTELPAWIADLTALTVLDLANNQLVELPSALGSLPHLAELDLTHNRHMILPPPDVVAQGTDAMLAFLRALDGMEPWTRPVALAEHLAAPAPGGEPVPAAFTPRLPTGSLRAGAAAAAVVLVGTVAALIAAGNAGGKEPSTGAGNGVRTASLEALGAQAPNPTSSASSSLWAAQSRSSKDHTQATPTTKATSGTTHPSTPSSSADQITPAPPGTTESAVNPAANPATKPTTPQYPVAPPNQDLALGRPVTATSFTQTYTASHVVDGDASSYWESTNGSSAFPQTLTVDLGSVTTVGRLVLDLPPVADWNQRTETITVLAAGADGKFTTLVGPRGYSFDARTGDSTGVSFNPTPVRYIQLVFTANSGWPAAQLSELGVFS